MTVGNVLLTKEVFRADFMLRPEGLYCSNQISGNCGEAVLDTVKPCVQKGRGNVPGREFFVRYWYIHLPK